jgi:hypothetical protein
MMKMKNKKLRFGFLAIIVLIIAMAGIWFSLDKTTRCGFIYGKNICNFYAMMDIANHNPSISDFDEMMNLCRDMSDVPKKDGCFEYVAQTIAPINMNKAKEACDEIKGFDSVMSRETCYDRILHPFTRIEPTKEMVEKIVIYDSKQKGFANELSAIGHKGESGLTLKICIGYSGLGVI